MLYLSVCWDTRRGERVAAVFIIVGGGLKGVVWMFSFDNYEEYKYRVQRVQLLIPTIYG